MKEGSALQTLMESMSVDQSDENIIYRKVDNEHVTNNKDDINRITEDNSKYGEIVDILLSEPKIKSIPGNENVKYRKANGADNKDDINNIVEYNWTAPAGPIPPKVCSL